MSQLPDIKFTARLQGAVHSVRLTADVAGPFPERPPVPVDPLQERLEWTTRMRFFGLRPRPGETNEERRRRALAEYERLGIRP